MPLLQTLADISGRGLFYKRRYKSIYTALIEPTNGWTPATFGNFLDSNDNAYIVGTTNATIPVAASIIVSPSGSFLSARSATPTNAVFQFYGTAVDPSGNFYAYDDNTPPGITKWNSSGVIQYRVTYNGNSATSIGNDAGLVDNSGNYFRYGGDGVNAFTVMKYTTAGAISWQRSYNILGSLIGYNAVSACIDPASGSTYYLFQYQLTSIFYPHNAVIFKRDSTGAIVGNVMNIVIGSMGNLGYLAVDSVGNLYMSFLNAALSTPTVTIYKINAAMTSILWTTTWSLPLGTSAGIMTMSFDKVGNVYFFLSRLTPNPDRLLKFDSSGNLIWQRSLSDSVNGGNGENIQINSAGDIILVGKAVGLSSGLAQGYILRLPPDGSKTGTITNSSIYSITYSVTTDISATISSASFTTLVSGTDYTDTATAFTTATNTNANAASLVTAPTTTTF